MQNCELSKYVLNKIEDLLFALICENILKVDILVKEKKNK